MASATPTPPIPRVAGSALALLLCAGSAMADESESPEPHWSGLPIWGAEAEARGYRIPLPFGVGVTAFSGEQPVDIQDLRLGRGGNPPVSVQNVLQIDRVDTTQQNVSAKLDVLVLPFLDIYALIGRTQGNTKGTIQVPGNPVLGFIEARQLRLDASFDGPTYGAGFTLQGGKKISEWRELTAIVVADWNRTRTDLSFDNQALIARTKPEATVFSARVGLHGLVGGSHAVAIWTGAMHQDIQQTVAGDVAGTDLQFVVVQSPTKPWNTLLGGLFEFGRNGYVLVEGGFGDRSSVLVAAVYRF